MSKYFVVKASGANISIPVLESAPAKPYIPIKSKGYIPLTTETNTTGVKVKGRNGKAYRAKVVTTTEMSSTYIGDYTTSYIYFNPLVSESWANSLYTTTEMSTTDIRGEMSTTKQTISLHPDILDYINARGSVSTSRRSDMSVTLLSQLSQTIFMNPPFRRTTTSWNSDYSSYDYKYAYSKMTESLTKTYSFSYMTSSNAITSFTYSMSTWASFNNTSNNNTRIRTNTIFNDPISLLIESSRSATAKITFSVTQSGSYRISAATALKSTYPMIKTITIGNEGHSIPMVITETFSVITLLSNKTSTYATYIYNNASTSSISKGVIFQAQDYIGNYHNAKLAVKTITSGKLYSTSIIPDYECTSYWTETTVV